MKNSIIAVTGLAATVSAMGTASIVNQCPYDVYVQNTPASGCADLTIIPATMTASGGSYSQTYTPMCDSLPGGWSIKLSAVEGSFGGSDIMQYEYNLDNSVTPSIVYYDISCVNGSPCGPWADDWSLTSSDTEVCAVDESAFMYPTDNTANQQCENEDITITLTLCGSSGDSGSSASSSAVTVESTTSAAASSSSYVAPTTTEEPSTSAVATTTETPSTTSTSAAVTPTTTKFHHHSFGQADVVVATTLATSTSANGDVDIVVVTEIATATKYVTAPAKREVDHHRHHHEARHPHMRR